LKLREGDLDNIVDDYDDDLGDEEAGLRARLEMQAQEEKKQTKAIITAITEGHDHARRMQSNQQALSFDDLIKDQDELAAKKLRDSAVAGGANNVTAEDDFDEEELLLKGLQKRRDRDDMQNAIMGEFDEDEDDYEEIDPEQLEAQLESMNDEDRRKEIESIRKRRERMKADLLKRKQFEEHTRMRRALRRAHSMQASGDGTSSQQNMHVSSMLLQPSLSLDLLSTYPTNLASDHVVTNHSQSQALSSPHKKRRTSLVPKHFEGKPARSHMLPSNQGSNIARQASMPMAASNAASNMSAPKRTTSAYKGTIDSAELLGGYGMGMAVTSVNARRTMSTASAGNNGGTGLFSTVTGMVNSSASQSQGDKLKRSFSTISRKHSTTSTGITLGASQQFMFIGDESSQTMSATNLSRANSLHRQVSSSSNSQSMSSSQQPMKTSALFNKLSARSNALKRSSSIIS
jgi:hypothetical protein